MKVRHLRRRRPWLYRKTRPRNATVLLVKKERDYALTPSNTTTVLRRS